LAAGRSLARDLGRLCASFLQAFPLGSKVSHAFLCFFRALEGFIRNQIAWDAE
jgi:hypothetical protein